MTHNKNPESSLFKVKAGVIFLATPHRGSQNAAWADIGSRLVSAAKLWTPGTQSAKEIKLFSNTVSDVHTEFVHLSNRFIIYSFHEQRGFPGLGMVCYRPNLQRYVAMLSQKTDC